MTPLRRRMLEDMQIRNFSQNTQDTYLLQVGVLHPAFRSVSRCPRTRRDPYLSGIPHQREAIRTRFGAHRHRRAALYLQRDAPEGLGCRARYSRAIPAPKKPQTLPVVLRPGHERFICS